MIEFENKTPAAIYIGGKEVASISINNDVVWSKTPPIDYFYVENTYAGENTLTLTTTANGTISGHTSSIEYSKDKENWTTISLSGSGTNTINMDEGDKVYFRNNSGYFNNYRAYNVEFYTSITCSHSNIVGGNIMSLMDYTNIGGAELKSNCFYRLFFNNTTLTSAELLTLPDFTYEKCYKDMFNGCSGLVTPPQLPARGYLASYCYWMMFSGCSSMQTAPILYGNANRANSGGTFREMFFGCSSLNSITIYSTEWTANNVTLNWLSNVSASGTIYNYGGVTLEQDSTSGVPTGWTEVTQ